jgi:hypothetical protein
MHSMEWGCIRDQIRRARLVLAPGGEIVVHPLGWVVPSS